ncbi:MICOS complex subunit MIC27 [Scomber japonicus]|uniref:MICOS complex subunit MIC27 n=1 Tax=Scomber japonicus TaxID=13676 RepID=UPI0023060738|nr:MICOS complex subunit MIC27 [Scomber japonicus]
MAAKVVMVAVPTVLGIASIRVYTVKEVSADGLVTREKLNIYNPLPPSTQVHFVPDKPGVIESGLTTARESILPFVHTVKGACVSVKRGSVNLYHAGEDLYYYLKDPPPGFLPRFGTITIAGLLGMFLARKGSRFKKLALPLGLMTAGASVCYPAQAVAVCKVTGKKVYAAGQWSSATVSSLLTYMSQEPVAKEIAASKPQAATVPNPESAVVEEAQSAACHASEPSSTTDDSAQSTVLSETEVQSVESVPVSDEPIVNGTEEVSSVTLTEISPDQPPTETNTDLVVQSVPAETTPPSELPAPVESEEPPALKPASEEVSTEASAAEPTPSLEPETVEPAPIESALAEPAPVESAPAEAAPVESAPVESAPAEAAPVESAPVESAPAEAASVESAPAEPAPVESAPAEAAAVKSAPAEAAPVESAPAEAAPVESAPAEAAPSTEEPPAPKTSEEPAAVAVVESADLESASEPELVAAVEEAPTPTHTPPPPLPPLEQPAADNNKGGSGFKPDPALMDFGQSNPEDEDLYSTRS